MADLNKPTPKFPPIGGEFSELVQRQTANLDALTEDAQRRVLKVFDTARRRASDRLEAALVMGAEASTPFTVQQMAGTLALLEDGVRQLQRELLEVLDPAVEGVASQSVKDARRLISMNEPDFRQAIQGIEIDVIEKLTLTDGLLLHQHSVHRYGRDLVDRIQQELAASVAQQMTYTQMRARVAGTNASVFTSVRGRAELIVRNEMNAAYNTLHNESITQAAEVLDGPGGRPDDPMMKQADEFLDARAHPFSHVINGMAVLPKEQFKVPHAQVLAKAKQLNAKRKRPRRRVQVNGVLWPKVGPNYVGGNYPGHHWERGRLVPYRRSWADEDDD